MRNSNTELMKNSFLPAAITEMSEGSNKTALFAAVVEQQDGDTPMERICKAAAYLIGRRRTAKAMDETDNGTRAKDMPVKPEHVFMFLQATMNKASWAARRLYLANENQEVEERLNGGTGIDWSQDVAESAGVDPQSNRELEDRIELDYRLMMRVYAHLCPSFKYMTDIEPVYMFQDRRLDVDEHTGKEAWITAYQTNTWEDTLSALDQIVHELSEKEDNATIERLHAPVDWAA